MKKKIFSVTLIFMGIQEILQYFFLFWDESLLYGRMIHRSIWMENTRAWWVIFEQSLKVKKNGFLFGCESSPEVLDLPKLMNRKKGFSWLPIGQFLPISWNFFRKIQREKSKKSLPMFSRTNCRFRLTREKCARVVVYRRLGILRSYTLGKCSIHIGGWRLELNRVRQFSHRYPITPNYGIQLKVKSGIDRWPTLIWDPL